MCHLLSLRQLAGRQAMDRAHRIGQTKPVLVLRLATQFSVEGRLLARANSKLALERLVIKRGLPHSCYVTSSVPCAKPASVYRLRTRLAKESPVLAG